MTAIPSPFQGRCFPDPFPPACASAWGDDPYGLWCEIEVGGVVQRLRWVEPGVFMMGSSEDERGRVAEGWLTPRIGNEGPQHSVTLTWGVWLSDTACTQALWLAVVGGDNPSHFRSDPDMPVENVSWDDVTERFLAALQRHLGTEVAAVLPTEAEWEYACRAGTGTAYSCGDVSDPSRMNFYSKETVPVKAYAPNPWGLYQMHGNVWEWCADDFRLYRTGSETDPNGGQKGVARVVRGGAWGDDPGWGRSASRIFRFRDAPIGLTGFRFALRSIEGGAGGGMERAQPASGVPQAEPGPKPPKAAARKR